MNAVNKLHFNFRTIAAVILMAVAFFMTGGDTQTFAHGGEEHGDQKPAVAKTENGTVSRTGRLGDFEILLKHSLLEPDTAASGRLFITGFATNEPAPNADLKVQVESASGAVTEIPVEKSEAAGSYLLKIPALSGGGYTFRVISAAGGKSQTLSFSGVEVAHQEAATSLGGSGSWTATALTATLLLVGLIMLGGLVYFAVRVVREPMSREAVSA